MTAVTFDIIAHDKASRVFSKVGKESEGLGKKLAGVAGGALKSGLAGIAVAAAGIGVVVASVAKESIDMAADLGESISKNNVIFGKSAESIHNWADDAVDSMGVSRLEAEQTAGKFGNLFKQVGFGTPQVVKMSKSWAGLAVDLASFHNADPTEIMEAMSAATRGEYDSLQQYVPMISAATVEHKAYQMTGKKTSEQLTAREKLLAVEKLMWEQTTDAQGDYARTSDSLVNRQKKLSAQMDNLKATIGEALMPVMEIMVNYISTTILPKLQEFADWFAGPGKYVIADWGITAVRSFLNMSIDAMKALSGLIKFFAPWADTFLTIAQYAFGWLPGIGPKIKVAKDKIKEFADSAIENLDAAVAKAEGWDATASKMQKEIRLKANIAELEGKIDKAKKRLREKGLTDPQKTRIRANIASLQGGVAAAKRALASIRDKTVNITTYRRTNYVETRSPSLPFYEKRAVGGPVTAGRPYLVGERGPEMVTFGQNGTVHTADDTKKMLGSGGGSAAPVIVNLNVNGPVGSEHELENWLVKAMTRASRKGRLSASVVRG